MRPKNHKRTRGKKLREICMKPFFQYQKTGQRFDAKNLKNNFLSAARTTKYIYSNIPEVNFSVDNYRKRIIGLGF